MFLVCVSLRNVATENDVQNINFFYMIIIYDEEQSKRPKISESFT